MNVYVITSQESDKHELVVHKYSISYEQAKLTLEKIAVDDLKIALGMSPNDHMESPLFDTIKIEDISQGLTIRYRYETSIDGKSYNDRVIDMIKIEKVNDYYLIPNKKRIIIKTFKIIEVEPISESGSVQQITEQEEYDSDI